MQNSQKNALPLYDVEADCVLTGMTKAEYATIHFIAAHLHSHGKYPTAPQAMSLAALAINTLDAVIPAAIAEIYPSAPDHSLDDQVDPKTHLLEDLE
jgi:hypothetical protein